MKLAERYSAIAPEQRKRLLFLLSVLAAVGFLMMPSASQVRRAIPAPLLRLFRFASPALPGKPSPFDGRLNPPARAMVPQRAVAPPRAIFSNAPPLVIPGLEPRVVSPGLPTPGAMLGKFEGRTFLAKSSNICAVSIELRGDAGTAGRVVAYGSMQCVDPMAPYTLPGSRSAVRDAVTAAAVRFLPVSFILSGAWEGGVLHFRVEKIINQHDDCAITSATMTPWGSRQTAFEWEDATCGKGEMMLTQIGM